MKPIFQKTRPSVSQPGAFLPLSAYGELSVKKKFSGILLVAGAACFYGIACTILAQLSDAMLSASIGSLFLMVAANPAALSNPSTSFTWALMPKASKLLYSLASACFFASIAIQSIQAHFF